MTGLPNSESVLSGLDKLLLTRELNQKQAQPATCRVADYQILFGELIGQGRHGKVYRAKRIGKKEVLACKVVSKQVVDRLQMYSKEWAEACREQIRVQWEFHRKLKGCSHIVELIDTIQTNGDYFTFMEYCDTDLARVLTSKGNLSEIEALQYFSELMDGYKDIFDRGAFHRDLKPQNLLLQSGCLKISDFGYVKIKKDKRGHKNQKEYSDQNVKVRLDSKVGSVRYMAPEVLKLTDGNEEGYDPEKSDVWSMGIILYKMIYGREPFIGKNEAQIMQKIFETKLQFPTSIQVKGQERVINVSEKVILMMKEMLVSEEEKRIAFVQLYGKVKDFMKELNKLKQAEELLTIYQQMQRKIYSNAVNYATLRELGIDKYFQFSCKIMTILHQRCLEQLLNTPTLIDSPLHTISFDYHRRFYLSLKEAGHLRADDNLQALLMRVYDGISNYQDGELAIKEVQLYLLDLMLLLVLELQLVKPDYFLTKSQKASQAKASVIGLYKDSTMGMIRRNSRELRSQLSKQSNESKIKSSKVIHRRHF